MNEELLQKLYSKYNLSQKGSYEQFKTDMADSTIQRRFFDKYGLSQKGSFEQFKTDLGSIQQPQSTQTQQLLGFLTPQEAQLQQEYGDWQKGRIAELQKSAPKLYTQKEVDDYNAKVNQEFNLEQQNKWQELSNKYALPLPSSQEPTEQLSNRPTPTVSDYITHSVGTFNKVVSDVPQQMLQGAGTLIAGGSDYLRKGFQAIGIPGMETPITPEQNILYNIGKKAEQVKGEYLDYTPDERLQGNFWATDIPAGLGSVAAIILSGGASAEGKVLQEAAKFSGKAVLKNTASQLTKLPVITGGVMMAMPEYDAAIKSGASEEDAFKAFLGNFLVGGTEVIPIQNALSFINKVTGNRIMRILKSGAVGSFEEAVQEGLQQYTSNKIAAGTYDPDRDPTDGLVRAMLAGATLGGGLAGTAGAFTKKQRIITEQVASIPVEPSLAQQQDAGFDIELQSLNEFENQLNQPNAQTVRSNEGQVPQGGTTSTEGQGQSSSNLQQQTQETTGNPQEQVNQESQEINDEEYNNFIDKGEVSLNRINSIANKVKNQQPLSERENAIFTSKTTEVNKIIADKKAFDDAYQAFMDDPSEENGQKLAAAQQALQASAQPSTRTVPFQQQISELGKLEPGQEFTDKARTIIEQSAFPEETKRELLGLLNVPKMNLNDKNKLVKALEKAAGTSTTTIKETTLRDKLREAWRQGISLGVKDAETRNKNLVSQALDIIKEAGAKLPAAKYEAIIRRIKNINTKNDAKVLETLDYVSKVAEDAAYGEKIDNVKSLQAKLKDARVAADRPYINKLRKVNPIDIQDVDGFVNLLEDIIANQKDATKASPVEFKRLTTTADSFYNESQKAKLDRMMDAKQAKSDLLKDETGLAQSTTKDQYLEQAEELLDEIADFESSKTDPIRQGQKDVLGKIKSSDLDKLSEDELYEFIEQVKELLTNDRFTFYEEGKPSVLAKLDVFRKIAESSEKPLLDKVNLKFRERTNLTAELLRLVNGIQSKIGPFMRVSGLDAIFNAGSNADVEYHENVKKPVHKAIKDIKRKFKNVTNFEELAAMQIYGMFSLRRPGVTEQQVIEAARKNYEQTSRKLKEGNPPQEILDNALRIDKVLEVFKGATTQAEIDAAMEKNYPGAKRLKEYLSSVLDQYTDTAEALGEAIFNKSPLMFEKGTYFPVTVHTESPVEFKDNYQKTSLKENSPTALLERELLIPENGWIEMNDVNGVLHKLKEIINAKHLSQPIKQLESFLNIDKERKFEYTGSKLNNLSIQRFIGESKQERYSTNEIDSFFNDIRRIGSIIYLSGIGSASRQLIPALAKIHTDFGLKRLGNGKMPIVPVANWAAKRFAKAVRANEAVSSRSIRVAGGFVGDSVETRKMFKDAVSKFHQNATDFAGDYVKPVFEFPSKVTFTAADQMGANEAWNVAYLDYLDSKGESIEGYLFDDFWAKEADKQSEPLRQEAKAAANAYVDANFIESGKLNTPLFYKKNIWFSYIFPYLKFPIQKSSIMWDRYRTLFTAQTPDQKKTAARQLVSDYVEAVTFQYITNLILDEVLFAAVDSALRKGEKPDEEEEKKLEKMKSGFRMMETLSALVPGGRYFFALELIPDRLKQIAWNKLLRNLDSNNDPSLSDKEWAKQTEMPSVPVTTQKSRANILDSIVSSMVPDDKYRVVEDNGVVYLEYEGFGGATQRKALSEEEMRDIEISAMEQLVGFGLPDIKQSMNRIRRGAIRNVIQGGNNYSPFIDPSSLQPPQIEPPVLEPPQLNAPN